MFASVARWPAPGNGMGALKSKVPSHLGQVPRWARRGSPGRMLLAQPSTPQGADQSTHRLLALSPNQLALLGDSVAYERGGGVPRASPRTAADEPSMG